MVAKFIGAALVLAVILIAGFLIFLSFFPIEFGGVTDWTISILLGIFITGAIIQSLYKAGKFQVTVDAWQCATILDQLAGFFGRQQAKFILREGAHLVWPWQKVVLRFSLKTQILTSGDPETPEEEKERINTEAGANFDVTWMQTWRVDDSSDASLLAFGGKDNGVVIGTLSRTMGSVIVGLLADAKKTVTKMLAQRATMNDVIKEQYEINQSLKDILRNNGVIVELSKVSNLQLDPQSQQIYNQRLMGKTLKEFMKYLKDTDLSHDKIANIFLAEDEVAQLVLVEFAGDIKGLKNLRNVSLVTTGGAPGSFPPRQTGGAKKVRPGKVSGSPPKTTP